MVNVVSKLHDARPQRRAGRPPHAVRLLGGVRHLQARAGRTRPPRSSGGTARAGCTATRCTRARCYTRIADRGLETSADAGPAAQARRAAGAAGAGHARRTARAPRSSARRRRSGAGWLPPRRRARRDRRRTRRTPRRAGSCGRPPTAGSREPDARPPSSAVFPMAVLTVGALAASVLGLALGQSPSATRDGRDSTVPYRRVRPGWRNPSTACGSATGCWCWTTARASPPARSGRWPRPGTARRRGHRRGRSGR